MADEELELDVEKVDQAAMALMYPAFHGGKGTR